MADHVFPQHGDFPDAASIAQLIGHKAVSGFVDEGMDITVDFGVPEFDVSAGKAYIRSPSYDTETPQIDPKETRDGVGFVVEFDGATGVSLIEQDPNFVYLDANIGTDDSPQIVLKTNRNAPSNESMLIAVINLLTGDWVEANRAPPALQTTFRNAKVFESDGSFEKPAEASRLMAILIGGGGGGGGADGPGGGGGGGAGGNVEVAQLPIEFASVSPKTLRYDVTVGSGGTGGNGVAGSDGSNTLIQQVNIGVNVSALSAEGGKGGSVGGSSPDGGVAKSVESIPYTHGFIETQGDAGGAGTPQESGARAMSGKGGDSMYGGGGAGKAIGGSSTNTKAGANGNGFGGGGSGGVVGGDASSGTTATGGDGADGAVIFMW